MNQISATIWPYYYVPLFIINSVLLFCINMQNKVLNFMLIIFVHKIIILLVVL